MALFGKKNANYISAKETKRISKENRKITNEIEKKRNRKNIPESEYITTMKNPENVVEFDNVHTYFFTDIGRGLRGNDIKIEEQYQIVKEIESRLSVCDNVEHSITESLEKAIGLRQSILKKAKCFTV